MTDYAQYQQPHHGHAPGHIQPYGGAQNPAGGNPSITSPTQQQQMHSYQQTSPILPSQGYGQAGAQHQQHPQQMSYAQQSYMPGMPQAYGMSPTQAAAMATAAAAGPAGAYGYDQSAMHGQLAQDPRASPRMSGGQLKQDGRAAPRSPIAVSAGMAGPLASQVQMTPGQMQQRRMSTQISSPAMQQPQPVMGHVGGPRSSISVPPQMSAPPQHQQSPELVAGAQAEEAPL